MADAQVTIKVTPSELRTIRDALELAERVHDGEAKDSTLDPAVRRKAREDAGLIAFVKAAL